MGQKAKEPAITATPTVKRRSKSEIEGEIKALKQEQESNAMHEANVECAKQLYDLYQSYFEVGFDEEQAWELIITQIKTIK